VQALPQDESARLLPADPVEPIEPLDRPVNGPAG
jgi:hypothetical protein